MAPVSCVTLSSQILGAAVEAQLLGLQAKLLALVAELERPLSVPKRPRRALVRDDVLPIPSLDHPREVLVLNDDPALELRHLVVPLSLHVDPHVASGALRKVVAPEVHPVRRRRRERVRGKTENHFLVEEGAGDVARGLRSRHA